MTRKQDGVFLTLLFGAAALAALTAFFLPALHVRDAERALLGVSAWEAVPVLTLLKLGFLGAAILAAFHPRLEELRTPLIVAAILMMFLPALGALMAGVYPGSDVHTALAQRSGNRTPWVDPGWGLLALLAAAAMGIGAALRAGRREGAHSA